MKRSRFWILPAVAILSLAGCGDADGGGEAAVLPEAPSLQELTGATVVLSSMDSLAVRLEDGGATDPTGGRIALLAAYSAQGDFDSDGTPETAVLVVAEPGGSGVFMNLVAFRHGPEGPVQVADRLLGDRQQIHRFEAVGDSLLVELTTQGPDDPQCCPTRRAQQVYRLSDGVWRLWRDNTLADPTGGDRTRPAPRSGNEAPRSPDGAAAADGARSRASA